MLGYPLSLAVAAWPKSVRQALCWHMQAVCEQSRRNEPFCKLENLAQHAALMQGFELPSCHAMHELWVCPF